MISADALYPIRVLSEATGIPTVTLRAWERRYGLLIPKRTPAGHRLYSDHDIALVKRVTKLTREGHSIGDIARRMVGVPSAPERPDDTLAQCRREMLGAVEDFSRVGLETVYARALSGHALETVFSEIIEPLLDELGRRWLIDDHGIAEEHFFSAWLRNHLAALMEAGASENRGPRLVCACMPGNYHEIGLMIFSLLLMNQGYQVLYLGNDMPLHPLPVVIERSAARALVLSSGLDVYDTQSLSRLNGFAKLLAVPVFMGGPLSRRHPEALQAMDIIPLGEKMDIALHVLGRQLTPQTGAKADVLTPTG